MDDVIDTRFDSAVDRAAEQAVTVRLNPQRFVWQTEIETAGGPVQVRVSHLQSRQFLATMCVPGRRNGPSFSGSGYTAQDAIAKLTEQYRLLLEHGLGALNAARSHYDLPEVTREGD